MHILRWRLFFNNVYLEFSVFIILFIIFVLAHVGDIINVYSANDHMNMIITGTYCCKISCVCGRLSLPTPTRTRYENR